MQENQHHELAKLKFLKVENRNLTQWIEDLNTTLSINKEMIQNLLLDPDNWDKVMDTMDQELIQYKDMLARKDKEIAALQGQTLLLEQINNEVWLKEAESNRLHEETIRDLRENLERKETMF